MNSHSFARASASALALIVLFGAALLFAKTALARVGVGMGAGEIRLTEPVKPGGIYPLPKLRIFNTGDEKTTYGMDVSYHAERPELRPRKEWFTFSPATFTLEAGKSQEISITMTVPVKAEPGAYFIFLESGPVVSNKPGTSIGIAVATKLFFTVVPANIFQAILFRTSSFFKTYAPWSWVGLAVAILLILFVFLKKFFSFNIAVRKN
jgi:P pilus assembly chaperone PapD